ncbi:tRNA (adenosine(37)-N6)-threonylcarbamoyltransferase complex ATPase subunit type 1 TsaE [Betaproteobacteria bacterium]|nr:tRNA (adenosine(37)-N6)-threonylcarbamoyltransferase complex ATPase subunit type 1 TsaE [Betaproteobacteria bacterium]
MDKKNKLVYKGIEESGFVILASKLQQMIESNALRYFYFSGEIGSGKTSYIRILLKHIGINENIKSPSFNMVEHYEIEKKIVYHVDLFRMKNPTAWQDGEIGSLFEDENALIFLEWPEKAEGLPTPDARLEISSGEHHIDTNKRDLSIYFKKPELLDNRYLLLPKC